MEKKTGSVLRSSARQQADGELKKYMKKKILQENEKFNLMLVIHWYYEINSLFRINVPFQMYCHILTTNYIQKCIESFANNFDAFDSLPIWLVNICCDIIAMLTFRVPNLFLNQNIWMVCGKVQKYNRAK